MWISLAEIAKNAGRVEGTGGKVGKDKSLCLMKEPQSSQRKDIHDSE